MERLCLKAGTPVDSNTYAEIVEVKRTETLQSRFFAPEVPRQEAGTGTVFQRLQQDSQTRQKVKTTQGKETITKQVARPGYRIEEVLLRKHAEAQLKRERLKAKWEQEIMKDVLPAPRINEYSKQLAEQHYSYGIHMRCGAGNRTQFSQTPSLDLSFPKEPNKVNKVDSRLLSMRLGKYSDLVLPEDTVVSVGKEDRLEDEETPIELAEYETVEKPAPIPQPSAASHPVYKSLTPMYRSQTAASSPDFRLIRTSTAVSSPIQPLPVPTQSLEEAEPLEIPEMSFTARSIVSDATVSRERAVEYQKMVKRHMELVGKRPQSLRP